MALNLWASTTDTEALFFASLMHVKADGTRTLLTRGWLRGSQRRLDARASKPWAPVHTHETREPLKPGEITEFAIAINAYGIHLKAGERLALRLKSADDEKPGSTSEVSSMGHLWRRAASHVTVHHDAEHPSHLLLPVTKGNVLGTFISGGVLPGEG
jgi:predicted acyl esterase